MKKAHWINDTLFLNPPDAEAHHLYHLLAAGIEKVTGCEPHQARACARAYLREEALLRGLMGGIDAESGGAGDGL